MRKQGSIRSREISSLVRAALDLFGVNESARWDILAENASVLTLLVETRRRFLVLKLARASDGASFEATASIYEMVGKRGLSPRLFGFGELPGSEWYVLALHFVRGATIERFPARTFQAAGRLGGRLDRALRELSESWPGDRTSLPTLDLTTIIEDAARAVCAAPVAWRYPLLHATARLKATTRSAWRATRIAHGDFHFGNILRTRRGFVAVDFDEAVWAAPGFDLATLLAQPIFGGSPTRARALLDGYIAHSGEGPEVLRSRCLVPCLAARLTWLLASNAARAEPRQLARGVELLNYSLDIVGEAGSLFDWAAGLRASR